MSFHRPASIMGFSPQSALAQWQVETKICKELTTDQFDVNLRAILQWHREPGTDGDHRAAQYMVDRLIEMGYDAELVPYYQYLRYPEYINLSMVEPVNRTFSFDEVPPSVYWDSISGGFVAYANSGKVLAPVVYVNYCSYKDIDTIRQANINLTGKLLLIRLGQPNDDHQTKPRIQMEIAEEVGAAGCIFYPDPQQDGFTRGAVYPEGPWRNSKSIFRAMGKLGRPGDVRSPGWASVPGASRLHESEIQLPNLPAISLSYGEARHILEVLDGPIAPDYMQGGFEFTYRLGGGAPLLRLDVEMIGKDYIINNVMATIQGRDIPAHKVYLGTHHDSWDGGAHDNAGGAAALLSIAESLASMLAAGYRPRRSIVLCSFDAEEVCYGGSTEFVEGNLQTLKQEAVAMMYVDGFTSGTQWGGSFAPSFIPFLEDLLKGLPDPLLDTSIASAHFQRHGPITFGPPGFVDTLPFYHMAGVPCAYHYFHGPNGVWHSAHDTLDYVYQRDPGHAMSLATIKVWLCGALRLANADILPLTYNGYGQAYQQRFNSLYPGNKNREVNEVVNELENLLENLTIISTKNAEYIKEFTIGNLDIDEIAAQRLNNLVLSMESDLLTPRGPQYAPWHRHTFLSPAYREIGYRLATFPELAVAIRENDGRRTLNALTDLINVFRKALKTQEQFLSEISRFSTRGTNLVGSEKSMNSIESCEL
ncbi:MAG: M28 family peptidase [Anaerolineales bacterium]|nr:M28 family peptidase [Anaerolineales bacterium]